MICSGSLLGVQYHRIASISVGYKTDYQMHSMDFEEFLWAKGYTTEVIEDMLAHMLSGKAFSDAEHNIYSNLFLEYCILGGMPAIVSNYIKKGTFEGSLALQRQLLTDYENDIIKYADGLDKAKILNVYRSIPAQLAKENKKFQYSKVAKGGRSKDYMGCVDWLKDAGLINVCDCLQFPELPLKVTSAKINLKYIYQIPDCLYRVLMMNHRLICVQIKIWVFIRRPLRKFCCRSFHKTRIWTVLLFQRKLYTGRRFLYPQYKRAHSYRSQVQYKQSKIYESID